MIILIHIKNIDIFIQISFPQLIIYHHYKVKYFHFIKTLYFEVTLNLSLNLLFFKYFNVYNSLFMFIITSPKRY